MACGHLSADALRLVPAVERIFHRIDWMGKVQTPHHGTRIDIYDMLPTTPADYDWYEDYRQSTEKFRGHNTNRIIPPWKLSYGKHHFTLIVRDNVGVADPDTFSVDVRDTVPPKLSIPADIHMVTFPPYSPTEIYLGEASATDACCVDNVYISNDAPANSLFPPGNVTDITRRADDGRGNTTAKIQKVYLYWVGEPHDWAATLAFSAILR